MFVRPFALSLVAITLSSCTLEHASVTPELQPAIGTASPADVWRTGPGAIACEARCPSEAELRVASPTSEADRVLNAALSEELRLFHSSVGRYACGDDALYVGRVAAREEAPSTYPEGGDDALYDDDEILEGDVLASLHVVQPPPWNGEARLRVLSPSQRKQIEINQNPQDPLRVTYFSSITPYGEQTPANTPWCRDCAPLFEEMPHSLALDVVGELSSEHTIEVRGRLEQLAPEQITFAQVRAIHEVDPRSLAEIDAFERRDDGLLVRRVENVLTEATPIPAGTAWEACDRTTRYALTWGVQEMCAADYDVEAFEVLEQQTCCRRRGECPPERCACDFIEECF